MEYERSIRVILRRREPAPYRRIVEVIDEETGEVLLQTWEDDVGAAFAAGERVTHGTFTILRDKGENGAFCYSLTDPYGLILSGWTADKKTPRKRGGRKNYMKLHAEKAQELDDETALALFRLANNINAKGVIVDGKRHRPLSADGIGDLLGVKRSQAFAKLRKLRNAGVLTVEDGKYIVNKQFLEKA